MYYTGYRGDIIMRFDTLEVKDKTGQTIVLRNAEESDAEDLIKYLRITTGETPFLIREPDEVKLTLEQEKHFITSCIDSERELMLIATINGRHIGNCSLSSIGTCLLYTSDAADEEDSVDFGGRSINKKKEKKKKKNWGYRHRHTKRDK